MRARVWLLLVVVAAFTSPDVDAQEVEDMSLNLLTAPSSPAFVLLGIEPTSIERPGSVTDVSLSLRNATDDFSALPESYAMSFAPYWWTAHADSLTYSEYESGTGAFWRTATISVATTTSNDEATGTQTTSLGVGFRVSLVQGAIDQGNGYKQQVEALRAAMESLTDTVAVIQQARVSTDPTLAALNAAADMADDAGDSVALASVEALIDQRTRQIAEEAEAELRELHAGTIDEMRQLAAGLPMRRTGFNADLALGAVVDFMDADFDKEEFRKFGVWTTGSWEYPWGAALGVGRIVHDWADEATSLDFGGRLIFDNVEGFSVSAEGLRRFYPNHDALDSAWRLALSADYSVGANRVVSFTFGRDFEGVRNSDLILALNFALGFGAMRPGF